MEAVLDFSGNKYDAAGRNFALFIASLETGAAAYHIIDFVLLVGLLQVLTIRGQNVKSSAHRRHAKKLLVQLAALGVQPLDLGQGEERSFQAKMPPRMSSVNCGIRLCACNSPSGLYHW